MNVQQIIYTGILSMGWMLQSCSGHGSAPASHPGETANKHTTHVVEIKQMKFFPAELRVRSGDTVEFINNDLVTHDITEASRKSWNSSPIAADQRWTLVANVSANYFCSIHPVMKGRIIVE